MIRICGTFVYRLYFRLVFIFILILAQKPTIEVSREDFGDPTGTKPVFCIFVHPKRFELLATLTHYRVGAGWSRQ